MPEWFEPAAPAAPLPSLVAVPFRLTSPAFHDLGCIPIRHGALGENVSPPLVWSEPPLRTRELAILLEERSGVRWLDDAFAFTNASDPVTRWLGWGLSPEAGRLDEGEQPPILGRNDAGTLGYSGPEEFRRHGIAKALRFSVVALDAMVALPSGSGRAAFDRATAGHVLATATLLARYERTRGIRTFLRRR